MDVYDEDGEFEASHIQHVYFGDIPLMTENGTFIINGTERVVVSQLHRSPGVFFDLKQTKTSTMTRDVLSARIIPNRGSWIDFEFDSKDALQVRIDRRKKLPASILLRALGYSTEELLGYFYDKELFQLVEKDGQPTWTKSTKEELLHIQTAPADIYSPDGDLICLKGKKFLKKHIRKLRKLDMFRQVTLDDGSEQSIIDLVVDREAVYGRFAAIDIADPSTGEVLLSCNHPIDEDTLNAMLDAGVTEIETLFIDGKFISTSLRDSLHQDESFSEEDALTSIYSKLRPNDPNTPEVAKKHFDKLLFDPERYDLSKVGRKKINQRLYPGDDGPSEELTTLTKTDLLLVIKNLYDLKNKRDGKRKDDIDHLGNRRIRSVGELLENQFRIGLVRMEKAIKERMSLNEIANLAPNDIINSKPVTAVIKEFFGASQLSQFMDQTNPLSEVTHKRRLSALGPGGLTRERAGNEVRDVHPTHYGRICPVETPEGPNVGLIASMATYARVNEYGFIETPYRIVKDGVATEEVRFFTALEEQPHTIVQAETPLQKGGRFVDDNITARRDGELKMFANEEISLMDVSPNQMVSVAASLVPFLENDDANRALMGANMQRQAVPLLKTTAPLVGTGMEWFVARDSGVTTTAKRDSVVTDVDATRIVLHAQSEEEFGIGGDVDIYNLTKFRRSNQNTCINQQPLVKVGDRVAAGDIIADGSATDMGELALGKNIVVAFMPWQGYNFEDSILISERLVKDDVFTSIHIEEFDVSARDTKLGKEEITRDIPNVGDDALRNLDEAGIIRVGAYVKTDDILVGKITPKGETQLTPEEKLLRAIFGEKAGDVKDSSLRARPGVEGVVMGAHVFSRDGTLPDVRAQEIAKEARVRIERDRRQYIKILRESAKRKLISLITGNVADSAIFVEDEEVISPGDKYTREVLKSLQLADFDHITIQDNPDLEQQIWSIIDELQEDKAKAIHEKFDTKLQRIEKGDDLPPGVIKMVKVYIAIKRKLQVGDKMAGRHGNKGVVSRVMPVENLPYLEDGTPVDIVLNPLGVPSRMNVGQVLETHLGWAARGLGVQIQHLLEEGREAEELRQYMIDVFSDQPSMKAFLAKATYDEVYELAKKYRQGITMATPVFSGASENEIKKYLRLAGLDDDGQTILYDGRTGEAFQNRVTVGVMYILKLHHLVDEKIHARSIGPYSLVTQQPLGGKAQFGGQRLGEMEVWALEAYGAAYSLQEFLTVKSDDVQGRTRMYESIVKGDNVLKAGLPESFNVLVKELQALALNVDLIEHKKVLGQ
jgi:DNA-directed RNA polymerase subunit beta